MRAQYQIIIVFILFCVSAHAVDTTNSIPTDKHVVEVAFAMDDMFPTQTGHTVTSFYISEQSRGTTRSVYGFADQRAFNPDPDAQKKAAKCINLMKSLDEPKELPNSRDQIVTVTYADGDKTIVKRFPIDHVPSEVHEVLTVMGFHDGDFNRLKFLKKAP